MSGMAYGLQYLGMVRGLCEWNYRLTITNYSIQRIEKMGDLMHVYMYDRKENTQRYSKWKQGRLIGRGER